MFNHIFLQKAAEKVGKVLTVVDQLKKQLYSVTGSKGQVIVQGRTLHYEVKAGFYKWKYEYKGKAWDEEAGISIKTKAYESEQGAREHALEDLAAELKKLGLLVD